MESVTKRQARKDINISPVKQKNGSQHRSRTYTRLIGSQQDNLTVPSKTQLVIASPQKSVILLSPPIPSYWNHSPLAIRNNWTRPEFEKWLASNSHLIWSGSQDYVTNLTDSFETAPVLMNTLLSDVTIIQRPLVMPIQWGSVQYHVQVHHWL